jgi:HD-GYP domain-containing protein (c-di-GMP phosphodiesterase class II)
MADEGFTLCHPIHTVDNQLLISADTKLSEENLNSLLLSGDGKSYPRAPLLLHGSIEEDIRVFLNSPPYNVIFSDQQHIRDLFRMMQGVHPLLPVLDSLDYFKRHDPYTYRHVLVVFSLSIFLGKGLVFDLQGLERDFVVGLTHDIGKICVPLDMLKKKDPLTQTERRIMQHHAIAGYVLLSYYFQDSQHTTSIVARDHHERKDGSGYPYGTLLSDKLVEIVTVSDIYDALISSRVYRPIAYDNRTALEEITKMAELHKIGWQVVKALIAQNRKDKPPPTDVAVSLEKRGTPPPGNVYGITIQETLSDE